jgi:hypothetical protein
MPRKEWTIMIYMAGDNNLSEDMIRAIVEARRRIHEVGGDIKGAADKNELSILVEFDGEHPIVPAKRYDLTLDLSDLPSYPASSEPDDVQEEPNTPAQRPTGPKLGLTERRIADFIAYSLAKRPANNYAVILSGHTDAFLGRTLLFDQDPSGTSTLKGISSVIREKFPNKLDVLAFDGCVMNSLEVAYEFKDVAKTWIGSQGSIPNFTWDYQEIADRLIRTEGPHLTEERLTSVILDSIKEHNCPYAFGGRAVDISAIDLSKIDQFANALNYSVGVIAFLLYFFHLTPAGSRLLEVLLLARWNCQTAMFDQSIDLVDFFQRLEGACNRVVRQVINIEPENVDGSINDTLLTETRLAAIVLSEKSLRTPSSAGLLAVVQLLASGLVDKFDGVVRSGIFLGPDARYCNGLSLFLPWSYVSFVMAKKEYKELSFNAVYKGWYTFALFQGAFSARPKVRVQIPTDLEKQILESLENLVSVIGTTSTEGGAISKFLDTLSTEQIDSFLVDVPLDTKISPPYNKGLDSYAYRFGKTTNLRPDLEITGTFPPRTEIGDCNSFKK